MKRAFSLRFLIVLLVGVAAVGYGLTLHPSFKTMVTSLLTLGAVLLLFNLMIIVHELGHFLAARWCGLKVEKFAIWFGKPIWSRRVDGVEYIFGTIPFGGYVAIPQMAPMESVEGPAETPRETLPPARPSGKIIVAFAGPLFSFLLAAVLATVVWVVGKPITDAERSTTIGWAFPGGPADRAGLRAGDQILSINGHSVHRWNGVPDGIIWRLISNTRDKATIAVRRGPEKLSFLVHPEVDARDKPKWYERAATPHIMIAPEVKSIVVDEVYDNSPAALAGIKAGDQVLALNGQHLYSPGAISDLLRAQPYSLLQLTLERGGKVWTQPLLPVRPISPKAMPQDGPVTDLGLAYREGVEMVLDHPTPWLQLRDSFNAVRNTLGLLFTAHSNVGPSQLSGPVGIMNIMGIVLSTPDGWRLALALAVVINVNLAMFNLFPLPVLDGGHILLSIIEWIRSQPLSMKLLEPIQTGFALLLFSYIAYLTFFDAQDSFHLAKGLGDDDKLRFARPGSS